MRIILFDKITGEIDSYCNVGDNDSKDWIDESLDWIEGYNANSSNWYVDPSTKELTERPLLSCSIDTTTVNVNEPVTITGIPTDNIFCINDEAFISNPDDTLSVSFDTEGEHTLDIIKFPFKEERYVINAI